MWMANALRAKDVIARPGWFDAPGKRSALRYLGELRVAAPSLDAAFLTGYLLGKG